MKKLIPIITAFILMIVIISCGGGGSKEANQTSQNTNEQKTASSDNQKTETKKEFFDMKYIYKGVRVDKAKFDEELKNLRNMQKGILIFLIGNLQMMMKEKNIL